MENITSMFPPSRALSNFNFAIFVSELSSKLNITNIIKVP